MLFTPDQERDETHERIAEIGALLALGLMRLHAKQSSQSSGFSGESLVDCVGHQSSHANPETEKAE